MANQHFVYGEFDKPDEATRAVSALVDASFEPDEIDVLAVRGGHLERVPIVHRRPVVAGALVGVALGAVVGIIVGMTFGNEAPPELGATPLSWVDVVRWTAVGVVAGALSGALGGLVWWQTKVDLRGRTGVTDTFIVGTTVPEARAPEVEIVLDHHGPIARGHYPVTAGEVVLQHASRQVIPRL